jgi:hypothetical protein
LRSRSQKLNLETTYSTNGNEIYQICLKTGEEKRVEDFLSPQALWEKTYSDQNDWRGTFPVFLTSLGLIRTMASSGKAENELKA